MPRAYVLEHCHVVALHPTAPFHFDSTVHKPDYFPSTDCAYERGAYWQSMRFGRRVLGTRLVNRGTVARPGVELTVYAGRRLPPDEVARIAAEIEYRFDLQADLAEFYRRCAADELLAPALKRFRGMRDSAPISLYETLVICTVLQNATVRRSVQMLENLFRRYGSRVAFDGKVLSAYWLPQALSRAPEADLRALKVGYRAKHLKRQAGAFVGGGIAEDRLRLLPGDELKRELLKLYGVGPASVWYLMFGVFKRYDAFDTISPWEQRIYSRLLFDRELVDGAEILAEVRARWGEWRMLAAHYLWEDLFWKRKAHRIPWLEELIRL